MARAPIGKHGRDHRVPGTLGATDPGGHDPFAGVPVYDNGTWVTTEGGLDFEDSTTVTWEVIDDPVHHRTIIKADASGGGGGGAASFASSAVGSTSSVSASTTREISSSSGPLNATATAPSALAVGDLIVVVLDTYPNGGTTGDISLTTIPAGWGTIYNYQLLAQSDWTFKTVRAVFWKFADGTEGTSGLGTWVFNRAGGGGILCHGIAHAFRGVASSGSIGECKVRKTALTGTSFSSTAPAVLAPDGSISLIVLTCPAVPPSTTWTFPSGYATALTGSSGQFNTALSWVAGTTGAAETVTGAGYSLGTTQRMCELAQIIIYPAPA